MKKELKKILHTKEYEIIKNSKFFDEKWYRETYDIPNDVDAIEHYNNIGYKLKYCPSNLFSVIKYELIYEDVRAVEANHLLHYEKYGKYEEIFLSEENVIKSDLNKIKKCKIFQDKNILTEYDKNLKKLIIFMVPEIDIISGGVMSINSIAKVSKELKAIHGSDVIMVTMPGKRTFIKYTKFDSPFNIYRFEQLSKYFNQLEEVIIHIPETYCFPFLYFIAPDDMIWLKKISNVTINILNQNINLMPRPRNVNYFRLFSNNLTMTCAHKNYCVKQLRTSYDMPVHLLSTSNLIKYNRIKYEDKKNILVYSIDYTPLKTRILEKIKDAFPNIELIEIKNLLYNDYLSLIGKAKWMITFGEGLDGYFAESARSGTIPFAAQNNVFFSNKYIGLSNIFENYDQMLDNIVEKMLEYDNKNKYNSIVNSIISLDKKEYDDKEYLKNIKKYYLKQYTFPFDEKILKKRKILIEKNPLVSIAMATYNGNKYVEKQITSILNMDYKNIELVISDDGSTDNTVEIIKSFNDPRIKFLNNVNNHGLNGNFVNALSNCNGEFIALSDQDDIWLPNKINVLLEHIDDFDLIHGGVQVIGSLDEYYPSDFMHRAYEVDKTQLYKFTDFIKENPILGCTTLFRRKLLKYFYEMPKSTIYHDWWLTLCAVKYGSGVCYYDKEIIKYRQHGKNYAFSTYNDLGWSKKKIAFDCDILKSLKHLTLNEQLLINTDINYHIIRNSFIKYFPQDIDTCLTNYYPYFSSKFINELKTDVDTYLKNE